MERRSAMLSYMSHLPRKMLSLHDHDAIAELVLHDLCSERCFNLNKAVYLVDNPDFNCMKGIAGFSRDEAFKEGERMWDDPHSFTQYVKNAPFNQKVRNIQLCSMSGGESSNDNLVRTVADQCAIAHPQCYTWDMKHNNRGVFIYEQPTDEAVITECLPNGVCLLSFCPIT